VRGDNGKHGTNRDNGVSEVSALPQNISARQRGKRVFSNDDTASRQRRQFQHRSHPLTNFNAPKSLAPERQNPFLHQLGCCDSRNFRWVIKWVNFNDVHPDEAELAQRFEERNHLFVSQSARFRVAHPWTQTWVKGVNVNAQVGRSRWVKFLGQFVNGHIPAPIFVPTKDLVPATQTLPSTNSQIRLTVQAWEYLLPL
jgi:hypothetical protein